MAKHNESHLTQTLQSMFAAQLKLHTLHSLDRSMRAGAAGGREVDQVLLRKLRGAVETQTEELAMAGHCLRTMYPAANEPVFGVAL